MPYSSVELSPTQQNKNRSRNSRGMNPFDNDDDDETLSDHTPIKNERYESTIDFDERTVSSAGSAQELSTDDTLFTGECFAPPGKLGIAIDTLNNQPVVHRVRDESPLSGVLRRLDVIIAVDDEDTSSMSAADVTTLMAKKMDHRRKITYLRGKKAVENLIGKIA